MAAQDFRTGTQTAFSTGVDKVVVRRWDYFLDFTAHTVAQNDTLKVMTLPKGAIVLATMVTVNTAATASTTMSVGDSGSGTRYSSALDITQAAGTEIVATTLTQHGYTAADYILLTIGGASPTVGQVTVSVLVADMSGLTHLAAQPGTF